MGQIFLKARIYFPQNATFSHNFNITTGLKQKCNERNQLQEFLVSWTLKKETINTDQSKRETVWKWFGGHKQTLRRVTTCGFYLLSLYGLICKE